MKQGIHPDYRFVTVQQTDGSTYTTRMAWESDQDTLQLTIDPLNHPAYTGKRRNIDSEGRIDKFKKKFGAAVNDNKKA